MIATIGVAIVVAGQFSGWNYGLAYGWVNMVAAVALMFVFYVGLLQGLAEMAATWPSAGGLAHYARLAFGEWVGGLLNVSMAMALVACAGIVGSFIASYAATVIGVDGLVIRLVLFMGIMALHLRGTKESMWVVVLAGIVAVATLLGFAAATAPYVREAHFAMTDRPLSGPGVIQAIPFALWLYLGVEQAVTASEEAENPRTDMPRGLMVAVGVLTVTAIGVIICAPGAGGLQAISKTGDPLLAAILAQGNGHDLLIKIIGIGAIFGLLASFFSITYSASRQIYDLARSGFFPTVFCRVSPRGIPIPAFVIVAALGFGISLLGQERVLLAAVLLFTSAYFLTTLAFMRLRSSHADTPRQYRAMGGMLTGAVTSLASMVIFYACLNIDAWAIGAITAVFLYVIFHRLKTARGSVNAF